MVAETPNGGVVARIGALVDGAWTLAVLASVMDGPDEIPDHSGRVLGAVGLAVPTEDGWRLAGEITKAVRAGQASSRDFR